MRRHLLIGASLFCLSFFGCTTSADDEFNGIVESRPEGKVGTWVVGGRSLKVTESAEFKEEHGPLTVGACAEVELEGDVVAEIESEPKRKCEKGDIELQGNLVEEEEEEDEDEEGKEENE